MSPPPLAEIVELDRDDLTAAGALVGRVWGSPEERPLLEPNTLVALHLAGAPLLGAFCAGRPHDADALIGVSIGFLGERDGHVHLHSHVTGIEPEHQAHGIGRALKHAQRDWALARGIGEIRWTFDPLVARNAHFNLTTLGARGIAYHVDLYGAMPDATNAGDASDRVEVVWDLDAPVGSPEPDLAALSAAGGAVILSTDGEVWPETRLVSVLLAAVPADVVALRHREPATARRWRHAARDAIGRALDLGYVATGATRDGWWVLERGATS